MQFLTGEQEAFRWRATEPRELRRSLTRLTGSPGPQIVTKLRRYLLTAPPSRPTFVSKNPLFERNK
jgi:hypothetical protein